MLMKSLSQMNGQNKCFFFPFETHLSQVHFAIEEEADVKVGSNKVPSPLKRGSGGLTRVVDVEVNELGHS